MIDLPRAINFLRPNSEWVLNGDTIDTLKWIGPGDPPTLEELEAAYSSLSKEKTWPNVQAFMVEFTMQEKAQIALSMDPTIAALRLELTTWLSEVHSDDPRVVMGLDKLVELGIISEQRKTEITTNP